MGSSGVKWGFFHPSAQGSQQPRPNPSGWVQKLFYVFHPFLNSPPKSEHFEYKDIGQKSLDPLRKAEKKFFGACGASSFPQNLKLQKGGYENFWGSGGGGGGGVRTGRPPRRAISEIRDQK